MPQLHKYQMLKARLDVMNVAKLNRLYAAVLTICTFFSGNNYAIAQQAAPMLGDNRDLATISPQPEEIKTLVVGQPIERELAGGETHKYQAQFRAGEFVRITVEQKEIDVIVEVLDPLGKQFVEVNNPNGLQETEIVSTVINVAGAYYVEVRSLKREATRGRYEIKLAVQRAATTEDRQRIAAEKTFAEGARLEAQRNAESLRQAIAKYEETLTLHRVINDRDGQAATLNQIGAIYERLGELKPALEKFEAALPLYRAVGNRRGEAMTLNNIGTTHRSLGEMQRALEHLEQALPLRRLVGDRRGEATTLSNIALTYQNLGELQRALEYLQQALTLQRALGERSGEAATLNNIGTVYYNLGEFKRALETFETALPLMRATGDRRAEAIVLNGIGGMYQKLGEFRRALEYYQQTILLRRLTGDRRGEAVTLNNIGGIYEKLSQPQQALENVEAALAIARAIQDPINESKFLFQLAHFKRKQNNFIEARSHIEAALAIAESLRTKVAGHGLRSSYFASVHDYYDFYVRLLMQQHRQDPDQGHDAAALSASERAKARSLLENLALARVDLRAGIAPELLERQRKLEAELSAVNKKQSPNANLNSAEQQESDRKIVQLTREIEKVQTEIKTKNPQYTALTQSEPLTLEQIQREVLDAETLLLEYQLGEEASYVWAVTKTTINSYELPKRAEIEAAARRIYDLLQTRNQRDSDESFAQRTARIKAAETELSAASAALSQILLAPIKTDLTGKRLLIVPDGALNYVPFAALPNPVSTSASGTSAPLIVNHEVIKLPSASVLAVQRRELSGRPAAARQLAVIADPVFDASDERVPSAARSVQQPGKFSSDKSQAIVQPATRQSSSAESSKTLPPDVERAITEIGIADAQTRIRRLPFARREAEQILALAEQPQSLGALDFTASRATAVSPKLSEYRIVHFATHGLLNNANPELSGLVLSLVDEQGRSVDGFLRLHDVYNLRLSAELVVLSACQTALGKNVRGEGLIGLTRGFMYAGAERVVASLWKVDDEATAELMSRFYQKMLRDKLRPAAALRAAQTQLQQEKRFTSPYYWAAFELQGEWK